MRSLENLIQLFPEKSGAEILVIQKQDKIQDEIEFNKRNEKKLQLVNDINTNGGYFKCVFGKEQLYFYNVTKCEFICGEMICDIEKITVFLGRARGVIASGTISIIKERSNRIEGTQYGLNNYKRISETEWNELNDYLFSIDKFWNDIKKVE